LKILITGGTGFFGRSLLRSLAETNNFDNKCDVHVFSRSADSFYKNNPEFKQLKFVRLFRGDVEDLDSFPAGIDYTHIIHAANPSTRVVGLRPIERFKQITNAIDNVLDFSVACGVKKILLAGSGGVYGTQNSFINKIPESSLTIPDPLNALSSYSIAKRFEEHLASLYEYEYGLNYVVARCFAFVGVDLPLNVHFAIGNFIRDALWAEEITVNGDGTPLRSYLDQRDLANWLVKLLMEGKSGEAYNVGSDEAVSISELAFMVRDLISPHKPVCILGSPQPSAERSRYVPDISKIYKHLGLRPTYSLKQSILDTAEAAAKRGKEACLAV